MRWLKPIYSAMAAAVFLSLFATFVGSFWPVNRGWQEAEQGTRIHVVSNGVHTGLILPVSAEGIDLSLTFRPTDLPDVGDVGEFVLVGWGDRAFYLETPTWAELKPRTALLAMIGSGESLVHVDHLNSPGDISDPRPVTLNRDEYRSLIAAVIATVQFAPDGNPQAIPGYGHRDVFYPARGNYSGINNCNVWTGKTLAEAGVRVGAWTPFSGGVMRWFEAEKP